MNWQNYYIMRCMTNDLAALDILRSAHDMEQLEFLDSFFAREIRGLEEKLLAYKRAQAYLQNHRAQLSAQCTDFSWPGFLKFVFDRDVEMANALSQCTVSTFDVGRLRVRAPVMVGELLIARAGYIAQLAKVFSGVKYEIRIEAAE